MSTDEEQQQRRTPFSAKLPRVAIDDAVGIAAALAELGAPATPHVIAAHMGTSYATNARFRTTLGAAGYYGLVEKQGERRALTSRGEGVISSDADAAQRARREAVMSTTFGPIIHSLRGRPINESAIRLRLQSDHSVPEKSAPTVSRALIDAAAQAGLASDGKFDAVAVEEAAYALPSEEPTPQKTPPKQPSRESPTAKADTVKRKAKPPKEERREDEQRPFAPGVQVVVRIDASTLSPQQIAELVRALQARSS